MGKEQEINRLLVQVKEYDEMLKDKKYDNWDYEIFERKRRECNHLIAKLRSE